ncbi:MAG TPA: O-antigen ligase family protein [Prolixibacteraceae bacterium]|nr:O-antigen ligase family protein [Prolixibacteraceae bacterium]
MLGILVPAALIVILIAIYSYEKLIWLGVILAPLSIPLDKLIYGLSFNMAIPTEPILGGLFLLILLSFARGSRLDKTITRHPVSIALYFYLAWMVISTTTSSLPVVSIKATFITILYVLIFYFILSYIFSRNQKKILSFVWLYTIAFVPVIVYSVVRLAGHGIFNQKAAHWVMTPFFKDHTSYGAVLAMFIPFLVGFTFSKWIKLKHRLWIALLLVFFIAAEIFSYTRAAWLSLVAGAGIWFIIKLKIKFKTLAIIGVSMFLVIFTFQDQILAELENNSTESSANLTEHLSSMTNISTDASNLERINRWHCAIMLYKERPVFGWGPGTYAMKYAPYQLTSQRTIISTNYADGGNAHSEYLGALSQTGLPGMLSFIVVLILIFYTAITAYSRTNDKRIKTILLSAIIALSTYYLHGFLNNFLDTDKAAIPFWGFAAMIVALDIYTKKNKQLTENSDR